ncbi:MAG: DUF368 domain-containing protein [Clostridiales bacterium]|nr:DUF368 domain-containing protein [Clostridiales bacterium]
MNQEQQPAMTLGMWLMRVVHGALIGVGAILPGVSGGVMCVLFGIYQPMMALLSHPVQAFRRYYKLFIPVLLGWAIGFVALAKVVEWAFGADSAVATCLFFGLILGTLPSLWREAGAHGRDKKCAAAFCVAFIALFALLLSFRIFPGLSILPTGVAPREVSPWWFFFCGAVWGLSLVLPGLSSSSILIFMGLYQPMTAGIGSLATYVKEAALFLLGRAEAFPPLSTVHLGCVLPLLGGILLTALLTARFINRLLETKYAVMYHIILGVVCASTLLILPTQFTGATQVILCVVCALIGFAAAMLLDRFGDRIKQKNGL